LSRGVPNPADLVCAPPPCRRAAFPDMTAETDSDLSSEPLAAHEPARRGGSIVLVLLVAAGIVAIAVALMTIGRAQAQPYILGVLALLAMVGLFNLFAFAAGIIRFTDRAADDPVMGRIADHAYDGLAVTDPKGHVRSEERRVGKGGILLCGRIDTRTQMC